MRGANRTGRPFTGDYAGDLLYATLLEYGFARAPIGRVLTTAWSWSTADHQRRALRAAARTSRYRRRSTTCRQFLIGELERMPKLRAIVALGRIAHDSVLARAGAEGLAAPFAHGAVHSCGAAHALRQLSLLALQHEHGRADDGHVPQRIREDKGRPRLERFRAKWLPVRVKKTRQSNQPFAGALAGSAFSQSSTSPAFRSGGNTG